MVADSNQATKVCDIYSPQGDGNVSMAVLYVALFGVCDIYSPQGDGNSSRSALNMLALLFVIPIPRKGTETLLLPSISSSGPCL